jgi:hypothetical protein
LLSAAAAKVALLIKFKLSSLHTQHSHKVRLLTRRDRGTEFTQDYWIPVRKLKVVIVACDQIFVGVEARG